MQGYGQMTNTELLRQNDSDCSSKIARGHNWGLTLLNEKLDVLLQLDLIERLVCTLLEAEGGIWIDLIFPRGLQTKELPSEGGKDFL